MDEVLVQEPLQNTGQWPSVYDRVFTTLTCFSLLALVILSCSLQLFWYPPCLLGLLSIKCYKALSISLIPTRVCGRVHTAPSLLLHVVRGQHHQSLLLFEQSTQTGGIASRCVRVSLLPPHFSLQFMRYDSDICSPTLTGVVIRKCLAKCFVFFVSNWLWEGLESSPKAWLDIKA